MFIADVPRESSGRPLFWPDFGRAAAGCPRLAQSVPSITDTTGAKAAPQGRGGRHRSVQDERRRDGCLTPENLAPVPAGCRSRHR